MGKSLLEPCVSQEARTVLRGRGSGDIALLPDKKIKAALCSRVTVFVALLIMPALFV